MPLLTISGCFTLTAFVSSIVAYSTTKLNYKLSSLWCYYEKMMWRLSQPPTDYRSACTIIPGAYCSANNSEFLPKPYRQDFIVWYSEWRTNIALGSVIVYVCYTWFRKTIQIIGGIEMLRPSCITFTCARTWNVMMIVQQKYENKATYLCSVVMIEWKRWQLWSSP